MPFEIFFLTSWAAKAHSCVFTESCLFPGADMPHSECAAPGQLGVGTGNRVGALAKSEASCFIECVLICPTFCTGSCCQWVNQVDGWPRLEGRGRWLKEGCRGGVWTMDKAYDFSWTRILASLLDWKVSDVILSWPWLEVYLVGSSCLGKVLWDAKHRACRLVSNHQGSVAGLQYDSHTRDLHSGDGILWRYLCRIHCNCSLWPGLSALPLFMCW